MSPGGVALRKQRLLRLLRDSLRSTHSGAPEGAAQTQEADGMQPGSPNDHNLQRQLRFYKEELKAKKQLPLPLAHGRRA